ncbi:hypothetical protein [Pseudomonas syringae]|uniref:hypothetical protein n=1 Tax=Pseudomonas syringae TaxID=317 RepID=UPI003204F190
MTGDIEKLEALAKGCRDEVIRSHGWAGMIDDADLLHRDGEFLKECSPDAVLELTQAIRDLQSSVSGLKTGYEACERVNAELRAECESLRKAASRYEWLRAETGDGPNIQVSEWVGPHEYRLSGEELDQTIDQQLSKEADQ